MRGITGVVALVAALGIGTLSGYAVGTAPDRSDTPPIPRCVSDDYNDHSQDRCWTESPDGVIVIDRSDTVISVPADVTAAPCAWWAETSTPDLPPLTRTDACVRPDGTLSRIG